MGNRNFDQVENVFHAALDVPVADRSEYVKQACNGDEALLSEVSSLLSTFEHSNGFMKQSALAAGFDLLASSSQDSLLGKSLNGYRIISLLGKGGMGEVYLAEDTTLNRKVALKFLSMEFVGDNWAKRQLIKEAQSAAMLDHPNICSVYGIEEDGERIFIVMQFIEGETLADLITKRSITPEKMLMLARQIVGALAEAHAHGIIHRDVKPRNIMVTTEGQVKVLDFGLAKTIQQKNELEIAEKSTSRLSENGILAGTVAYMSPEQLRGERLDFRTDIFSLGTVLYELIEHQNPFRRASEAETISAILTSEPPAVKNGNSANQLSRIMRKCLAKDRDKRYQSASEVLIELGSNSTASSRYSINRYLQPWLLVAASLLLILATALVTVLFFGRPGASTAESPANKQPAAHFYSLAVMPITSNNPIKSRDYLTEGLTISLIEKLSSLSQVRVTPYGAVSGYKGKRIDPKILGGELKVDTLFLGHVVDRENKQILQSRLVKASDGSEIMSSESEIKWQTILQLQEELTTNITKTLDLRLSDERRFLESHGTSSPEAFREYVHGQYLWRMRDKENIKKAISHFQEAIRLDPAYAQAHAGLADSYVLLNLVAFGETPTAEAMSRATFAAREALKLDDKLPEAHTSLGVVNLRYEWKWNEAERYFKRAIELDDNYAPAHYWYSQLLLITGRRDEAIAESEKAKNLDPFSHPTVMNYCRTLSLSRQYDQAIACYDKLLLEKPKFDHAKYLRALVLQRSGRYDEALIEFQRLYATNQALAGAALGYAYGRRGNFQEAQKVLSQMKERAKVTYVPPWEFAIVYTGLGDKDNAFAWLEHAYTERFATLTYITVDPIFAGLSDDPRYVALVNRLNLPPPAPW